MSTRTIITQEGLDKKEENLEQRVYQQLIKELPNSEIYENYISNIFNNILEYDVGFIVAVNKLEENSSVELKEDLDWVKKMQKKISRLIFLKNLLEISNLGEYTDRVLNNVIDNFFPASLMENNKKESIKDLVEKVLSRSNQK
jgi:hypothetical protein